KADMNGVRWLEYILNNQTLQHRVCMFKNGKKKFFLVQAKLLTIDERYHSVVVFTDVTEIEKLSNLLDNTINSVENLIFVKDNKFRYLECNEAFEKFIGLSRDKLIGKSDYDLFDKDVADFFRKKDKEMLACGEARQNYEWVTYPDGKKVYLLTFKSPLHNRNGQIVGLVGNSADLTEQKRLEKELLSSKQQFEKFMEFIPASIFIKDENSCIVYANTTAKAFFNNKDIIGLKVEDFLSAADIKTANELENKIIEFGKVDEIKEFTNYNNEKKIFRTLGFKIEDENTQKIAAVIVDITKEFHLQEELRKEGKKSQQLGMILENSIDEIYVFAKNNFRFLYINQGAKII
ncbi:MAG: PAS domain S-box protein, partial [Sulfurimonas sp.]|nr:PAS domain S-box protein [Sulfurimonas sp.]